MPPTLGDAMPDISLYWEIGAYDAPVEHTSTTYRVAHLSESDVSIVFDGTGLTYDANNIPTGGSFTQIRLMVGSTTLASLDSLDIDTVAYGDFVRGYLGLRSQIGWRDLLVGELDVVSFTDTKVRVANSDGTFTDAIGTGLGAPSPGTITGNVDFVNHVEADGHDHHECRPAPHFNSWPRPSMRARQPAHFSC